MPVKPIDKEALKIEYDEKCPKYRRLGNTLKQAIETLLVDSGLEVLTVDWRLKTFSSFCDKIERKCYTKPFEEIEDICGIRIICYYASDLEKITRIIDNEFKIIETIDKSSLLEPDRFGYRSFHYIITLKKDWLSAPNYRGLGNLKVELQLRTILMHAWAGIEHKLAYKKIEHIPDQFKRRLYRLSALFEIADEQFENLRNERNNYKNQVISEGVKKSGRFKIDQNMNLDSLQAFLDFYFPDRDDDPQATRDLLDDLIRINVSFADLVDGVEKVKDVLPQIEAEDREYIGAKFVDVPEWAQVTILMVALEITNDKFWELQNKSTPPELLVTSKRWRKKISQLKK